MALRIGCAAAPGQARENKTGSWRVFRPEFDHDNVHPVGCVSWSVLKGAFALKIMNSTLTMISVKDAGSVPMNARQKQSPWKRRRNR